MSPRIDSPAVFFHPDAYDFSPSKLMGRQSAGLGFLRAVVAERAGRPVTGYGPPIYRGPFDKQIKALDAAADTAWLASDAADSEPLSRMGVVHRADPVLSGVARLRLRAGPGAYCLTGVTHTLSSASVMEGIAALLTAPLQEWDAVVCTSAAAQKVVGGIFEAEAECLRWKFGSSAAITSPRTPVIPLGVHVDDFVYSAGRRAEARTQLQVADDEVVALYVGRLSFHSKAHPFPMFRAAQAAVERTGGKLTLACFGRAPSAEIGATFTQAAAQIAPNVRVVFLDGVDTPAAQAWACADLFLSFADSIQETFGLTPVEAMAAGLPSIVSDWNGYRDSVRDGVDGFRVPSFMPAGGAGEVMARAYEAGVLNDDLYGWHVTATVGVDVGVVTDRLSTLLETPDLRRSMSESGKARARAVFDWRVVYAQYQALWTELNERRLAALATEGGRADLAPAPRSSSSFRDPYRVFGEYPTHRIGPATKVTPRLETPLAEVRALLGGPLFRFSSVGQETVLKIWGLLKAPATVEWLSHVSDCPAPTTARAVALLAKMDVVTLTFD